MPEAPSREDPSGRVAEAMRVVERRHFLPPGQAENALQDAPVPIGHGVTNSQPTTVRIMLELLDVRPGDRVLDVGSGSGWTTALLAQLVGEGGSVVGVERVPELVSAAHDRIAAATVEVHHAIAGVLGWPDGAPYDRILVSAEPDELPGELVDQLATAGVMVVPVRGEMLRVVRTADGIDVTGHGAFRFVPLLP